MEQKCVFRKYYLRHVLFSMRSYIDETVKTYCSRWGKIWEGLWEVLIPASEAYGIGGNLSANWSPFIAWCVRPANKSVPRRQSEGRGSERGTCLILPRLPLPDRIATPKLFLCLAIIFFPVPPGFLSRQFYTHFIYIHFFFWQALVHSPCLRVFFHLLLFTDNSNTYSKNNTPVLGNAVPVLGVKLKREYYVFGLVFEIGLRPATSFERSRGKLSRNVAEHRSMLKNDQNTYYPRFSFTPKTGIAFPETQVLVFLWG